MSAPVVLVAGPPRSGTTWVAEVLIGDGPYVHEPDNEGFHPLAVGYKRAHRFPPGDEVADSGLFDVVDRAARGWIGDPRVRVLQWLIGRRRWALEEWIGTGGRERGAADPDPTVEQLDPDRDLRWLVRACRTAMPVLPAGLGRRRTRLVKSVHAVRCLPEVVASLQAAAVDVRPVVVVRNPWAITASLLRPIETARAGRRLNADVWRGLPDSVADDEPLEIRAARQTVELLRSLAEATDRHPGWVVASHDELCRDPVAGFDGLARRLGLDPSGVADRVAAHEAGGEGYQTTRVALDQIDRWRGELSEGAVTAVADAVADADLGEFLAAHRITGER